MKLLSFARWRRLCRRGRAGGHRRPHRRAPGHQSRNSCSGFPARNYPVRVDIDTIGQASIARLRSDKQLDRHLVREPKFLPPVWAPPKILALALNYQEHIDETNLAFYNEPIVFEKYASNLVPHEGEIELPPFHSTSMSRWSWRSWSDATAVISGRTRRPTTSLATQISPQPRRVRARPPARAAQDGPALFLCQELRHVLSDGPMGDDRQGTG